MSEVVRGYKAMNSDMICKGYQYTIGEIHRLKDTEELKIFVCGFHFCRNLLDCFTYYPTTSKVYEIEATGHVCESDSISCTDEIRIIREVPVEEYIKDNFMFFNGEIRAYLKHKVPEILRIPSTINGQPIHTIASESFSRCPFKEVHIAHGITTIKSAAFCACFNLEYVELPGTLTYIDDFAFDGSGLETIDIPDDVTYIGHTAFGNCSYLSEVYLPKNLDSICPEAFKGCYSLKDINFPDKLKFIGFGAFGCCTSLESIDIPDSVEKIEHSAFGFCENLKSVKMSENVKTISVNTFQFCEKLTDISLPKVECIELGAFFCCTSLTNITLPATIQYISAGAFSHCSQLEKINVPKESKVNIPTDTFSDCPKLTINYIDA